MNIQRAAPVNELLAKLIFLILPTAVIGYFLLYHANIYFTLLQNDALQQAIYFAAGMGIAAVFYAFRFRFLPTFILLILAFYTFSKGLDRLAIGEFDGPKIHLRFLLFSWLFTLGWIFGWGFLRLRYWSVLVASTILCGCILIIAKSQIDTVDHLLWAFAPTALFAVYIVFAAEQIYSYKDKSQKFWWFLTRRLVAFTAVAALFLMSILYWKKDEIKETVANFGGGGKAGANSMLKKNKHNEFDLKKYSELSSMLSRDKDQMLFCAHINNFFENSPFFASRGLVWKKDNIPNPLYLTAFYYSKFDTSTETFETDTVGAPETDLFEPDPSKLSLFATKTDSSVIRNSGTKLFGKTVEIEVYTSRLSPSTYLAPHTGYFVQPITVEKDFRDSFKYAFRAKSYVSELNSAYFIYNAKDPQIKQFQEIRFQALRGAAPYGHESAAFMKYYTFMPKDTKFDSIGNMARRITANSKTTVDKVLAMRDWFLSNDEAGQPLFKYTDNPGVPDIPNASKLMYFLFQNRKGYCAYYAGATLFMLRSLGVPSRIAVGFLTESRSDKNPGWYWYYGTQAHAWVQVYFPGFGWLDFDTTVGNSDAHDSPKPDGTPPLQPPKAYLAADGIVTKIDTVQKIVVMKVKHVIFHDKEYTVSPEFAGDMDVHIATIRRDSIDVPLTDMKVGEAATAVSYADAFKGMEAGNSEKGIELIHRFPNPEPIDEIYLKRKDVTVKDDLPQAQKPEEPISVKHLVAKIISLFLLLILFFLLLPGFIWTYYKLRVQNSKNIEQKAYWTYRAVSFYLNQLGFIRGKRTPMQYARDVVDQQLETKFTAFMIIYLKQKYARQPLNDREQLEANSFFQPFIKTIKQRVGAGKRFFKFLNLLRSISFFVSSDEDATEE